MFDFAAIGSLQHLEVSLELRGATIVLFVVEKVNEVTLIQIVGRWGSVAGSGSALDGRAAPRQRRLLGPVAYRC